MFSICSIPSKMKTMTNARLPQPANVEQGGTFSLEAKICLSISCTFQRQPWKYNTDIYFPPTGREESKEETDLVDWLATLSPSSALLWLLGAVWESALVLFHPLGHV